MTFTIVDSDSANSALGAAFRSRRSGPELDLIDRFLDELPFAAPRGCHATIFREPRIASGFPDLVIVYWSIAATRDWVNERSSLTRDDIRIAHYLHHCGPKSSSDIRHLGQRSIKSNLERLEAARLIRRYGDIWQLRALTKIFAARRIIAVEAKISEWSVAVNQAHLNTWFASDTFVLVPEDASTDRLRKAAKPLGVRVCRPGKPVECNRRAFPNRVPRSYASWLFNEWAWRSAEAPRGTHR